MEWVLYNSCGSTEYMFFAFAHSILSYTPFPVFFFLLSFSFLWLQTFILKLCHILPANSQPPLSLFLKYPLKVHNKMVQHIKSGWKNCISTMKIPHKCYANLLWINLQCKFTTLPNDYKIAICLAYIFNVFQTICIRLSVSVSQIIQNFKCKVNIKCYIFNNMQSNHILFLLSTSTVVQEHIIAVFSLVI